MDDLSPETRALLECARAGDELPRRRRRVLRRRAAAAVGVALPLTFAGKVAAGIGAAAWIVRGLAVVGVAGGVAVGVTSIDRRMGPCPSGSLSAPRGPGAAPRAVRLPQVTLPSVTPVGTARDEELAHTPSPPAPALALHPSAPDAFSPVARPRDLAPPSPYRDRAAPEGARRASEGPTSAAVPGETALALVPISAPGGPANGPDSMRGADAPAAVRGTDALATEARLVGDAEGALENGSVGRAFVLLAEHDKLFPSGALEPESAALRIDALCASGRRFDAQAAAVRFRARHPGSPLARRASFQCLEASGVAPQRPPR